MHVWPFQHLLKEKSSLQALMLSRPGVLLMYVFMLSMLLDSFARSILFGTLPIDFITPRDNGVPLIGKVVVVCCALSNICDSVIPFDSLFKTC